MDRHYVENSAELARLVRKININDPSFTGFWIEVKPEVVRNNEKAADILALINKYSRQ